MNKLKILLIGPLPPPLGGTTILFETLYNELLDRPDVSVNLVNSNIRKSNVIEFFRLLRKIHKESKLTDIFSLHASPRGFLLVGSYLIFLSRIQKKKILFRMFGGDFNEIYGNSNSFIKKLYNKYFFKGDLILFETKEQINEFLKLNSNMKWFPNHRAIVNPVREVVVEKRNKLKAVFISHIKKEKGIFEFIEVSNRIDEIDFYVFGPFCDGLNESIFKGSRVEYCGIMERNEVIKRLSDYDILVLPSFREGYPGIIIEALMAGLAIVTSNLSTIREMVTTDEALFVEPGNVNMLYSSLKLLSIDNDFLIRLKENSKIKSSFYNSEFWTEKFIEYCRELTFSK